MTGKPMNDKDTVVVPELLPCPFCGAGGDDVEQSYWCDQSRGNPSYVKCLGCGVEIEGGSKEEVISAWNTRAAAPSTSVREEASALVARLRAYRPVDEWGEGVRHTICDEAADALEDLAALKPSTDKGGEE